MIVDLYYTFSTGKAIKSFTFLNDLNDLAVFSCYILKAELKPDIKRRQNGTWLWPSRSQSISVAALNVLTKGDGASQRGHWRSATVYVENMLGISQVVWCSALK